MYTTSLLVCSVIFTAAFAVEVDDENVGLRAASRNRNCGCQCSSLTFKDKYGNINGNCKSTDRTGAVWCYVESGYSTCSDLRTSSRFNKQWSYEACATPEVTSYECQGFNNYNNGNNNGYNNGNNNGYNNNGGSGYNNGYNNNGGSGYNNGYNTGSNNGYPCRDASCGYNNNNGYGSGSSIGGSGSWNTGSSLGGILTGGSSGSNGYPVRGSTRDGASVAAKDADAINFEQ